MMNLQEKQKSWINMIVVKFFLKNINNFWKNLASSKYTFLIRPWQLFFAVLFLLYEVCPKSNETGVIKTLSKILK